MVAKLRHPDINIMDDFAKNILEKQFPELSPVKIKCIADGLDNKVFLVNDQYVFKFPHRAIAALIFEREHAVLENLQEFVNLLIPNPIYIGKPCGDYPFLTFMALLIHRPMLMPDFWGYIAR